MSIQSSLENAASGLMMMSESDYPFDYVSTNETVFSDLLALQLTGKRKDTPVAQITLDYLLRNMTNPASGSVAPETAVKFQQLAAVLKQELKDITVYRVGMVQVDVLILGISSEGTIAGMRTKLIET